MSQGDHETLIKQVVEICQTDENTARSYLQLFNWNLNDAVENLLNVGDEGSASDESPEYKGIVSGSTSVTDVKSSQPTSVPDVHATHGIQSGSSSKIATLSSLAQKGPHNPESDEEHGQAFYVGGAEHGGGGQQVLGPPRLDNPESFVRGVFRAAQDGGAETLDRARVSDLSVENTNQRQVFVGTGYRLGESLSDPLVKVPGKSSAPRPKGHSSDDGQDAENNQSVIVKMWHNGFSLDDGPLRSYTDPSSLEFMDAIKQGRIPAELIRSARNREVHVLLEDHHNEPYQAPASPKVKAFSGVGHVLGNPTPRVVTCQPSVGASSSPPSGPTVDQSQPTTQIQVRMPDGSRLLVTLNHKHTIQDLRTAIMCQRPELANQMFGLFTTFPRQELTDNSATLASSNLLNAALVVTKQ
ncbi:unnamed protein product [Mesocestoides corti]|uniref:NSFL1 cofactor p47 n=1 Tax=Mesocestoides corti TaxID=53468 RepID=A0A0R3UJ88_MESCO|nr:unnamed protein product [Mesocestoides corti]